MKEKYAGCELIKFDMFVDFEARNETSAGHGGVHTSRTLLQTFSSLGAIANSKLVPSIQSQRFRNPQASRSGLPPCEHALISIFFSVQSYPLEEGIGLGMSLARDGVERVGRLSHQVAIVSPDRVKAFTVVEQPDIFTQIVTGHDVAVEVLGPER